MKRKIISIILILICTICIIGNTSITNADASEYSYENFLDSYNDNDYIKLEDFYKLLFLQHDIDPYYIDHFIFSFSYKVDTYGYYPMVKRETALIDLMRSYMLIPDPSEITLYPWKDIDSDLNKQYLAYISYAKELGITNGITKDEFGFGKEITIKQLKAFINRINSLDLNQLQTKFKMNYKSVDSIGNLTELAIPLVIEYLNTLPDFVEKAIIENDRTIMFCDDTIPDYEDRPVIGLTNPNEIRIITTASYCWKFSFNEILVHEFGHVVHKLSNMEIPYENFNEEKLKLSYMYTSYATENELEYIACAWTWLYITGDEYFSKEFPETYKFIQDMIMNIK